VVGLPSLPQYRGGVPLFTRRPSLPAAIRTRLDLPSGDRVLVAAELTDGRWAAAARRSLYVAGPDGDVLRRPWSDVDRASLAPETSTITVNWVDGSRGELALAGPGAGPFAQTLRERVQSSVVHSEIVGLPCAATRMAGSCPRSSVRRASTSPTRRSQHGSTPRRPGCGRRPDWPSEAIRSTSGLLLQFFSRDPS
jgi:hypothetical protein